jgi:hypothetical protein
MQGKCDQVSEALPAGSVDRQQILGGKEPVVARQPHLATLRDRPAQDSESQGTGSAGGRRGVEEHPHVRALPGARDFQRGGNLSIGAHGVERSSVLLPLRVVEVADQKSAGVVRQHWI